MNMDKDEFLRILSKYRRGEATEAEEAFLHSYYNLFDARENPLDTISTAEKESLKNSMKKELQRQIALGGKEKDVHYQYRRFALKWVAAAVILFASAFGVWFYQNSEKQISARNLAETNPIKKKLQDIAPGGNKATLILADGSSVVLDSAAAGLVANQSGAYVNKTKDGELIYSPHDKDNSAAISYNMISIPRGGQYSLVLSDGTKVWLNSASSIRFPTSFSDNERRIEVTGEAYFEVSHVFSEAGGRIPFIVRTRDQEVKVLGTHFNISAYEDEEHTSTTLLEGSVIVKATGSTGKEVKLQPGQQAIINPASSSLRVQEADLEKAVAWKNGYFKFDKEDLPAIMRQVSRWYDVDVEYRGKVQADQFVGKIRRTTYVSGVLRILELSNVNCHIEGRKIIVGNN